MKSNKKSGTNGGVMTRVGKKFHIEIESMKILRIKKDKSKSFLSTEKITNLIIRHKLWAQIKEDVANLNKDEVEQYGI